jgi:hypothetical protein
MAKVDRYLPDSPVGMGVYQRLQFNAGEAAAQLAQAAERPVRHNRRIERAALWHLLSVEGDCHRILDPAAWPALVRPKTGGASRRYDVESAIRTIPTAMPFTQQEGDTLRANMQFENFQFEHGIGDVACGQLALCERWHDWLWSDEGALGRVQSRSRESEVLEIGCARLSEAVRYVMGAYYAEHPPGSDSR